MLATTPVPLDALYSWLTMKSAPATETNSFQVSQNVDWLGGGPGVTRLMPDPSTAVPVAGRVLRGVGSGSVTRITRDSGRSGIILRDTS